MCFCLLTANYTALGGIRIQNALKEKFYTLTREELTSELVKLGHRFPNTRARFICEARRITPAVVRKLKSMADISSKEAREWLADKKSPGHVKGLGMKESSHFLRNVGYKDIAIIDKHILRVMHEYHLIPEIPKSLSKKKYLEFEEKLSELARLCNLNMAELDLYLWYMKTGKILK